MARYQELPKDTPVVLYCRTGNRSEQAAAWLAQQGYTNILNLRGGIVLWYRMGLPVEAVYATTLFKEVGPEGALALVEDGAFVVDVRETWEYQGGHIPKAVNIPLSTLPTRLFELPKDRIILLVCNSGNRSGMAAEFLVNQGFDSEKVVNLEGGTHAWTEAGLPVER